MSPELDTTTHEGKMAWQRNRRRQEAYGRWVDPFVDCSTAVAHINALRDRYSLSYETINHLGGFTAGFIEQLMLPAHNRYRTRVRRETHEAVMAIRFDLDRIPAGRMVPSAGTQRRLRALSRIGWSQRELANRLGVNQASLSSYFARELTTAGVARAVRDLYDALWRTPGTSVRSVHHAERLGWAPPLAWDDDTIDDPNAAPNLGEVTRMPTGGSGRPSHVVVEDVEFLLEHDAALTLRAASERLGLEAESLKTALRRAGRHDLRARLTHNSQASAA